MTSAPGGPASSPPASTLAGEKIRILALDDEPEFLRGLGRLLRPSGFDLVAFQDPEAALAALAADRDAFDIMLIDRNLMANVDGFDVLARARALAPDVCHIMLTGDLRDVTAATALRLGAFHFLTKPVLEVDAVALTLVRAAHFSRLQRRARVLERRLADADSFGSLVGASAAMRGLYALLGKVADTDLNILIHGESGTGKELVARSIHERSARSSGPFIAVNCGAIPESLIDSELFGHVKGAFTGATEARPGVFVEANGGTLLLDEIGELPPTAQVRLLRVLQEREVRALGSSSTRPVDVRVLAATHVDLAQRVKEQRFRLDLLYRLNVATLTLPALRERLDDVPMLVHYFVAKHAARAKRPVPAVAPELLQVLIRQDWPGNVRELENVVQYALALTPIGDLEVDALPPQLALAARPATRSSIDASAELEPIECDGEPARYQDRRRDLLEAFDRKYFTDLVTRTGGNLSEAARLSGIDRSNLRRMLSRLGLRSSATDDVEA